MPKSTIEHLEQLKDKMKQEIADCKEGIDILEHNLIGVEYDLNKAKEDNNETLYPSLNCTESDTPGSEQCPYFHTGQRCNGVLKSFGVESTCMGTINNVDPNQQVETFECKKCGKKFSRSYKWKEI